MKPLGNGAKSLLSHGLELIIQVTLSHFFERQHA